jgi:hypothetical protein
MMDAATSKEQYNSPHLLSRKPEKVNHDLGIDKQATLVASGNVMSLSHARRASGNLTLTTLAQQQRVKWTAGEAHAPR